jgi:DNA replication and repair protein RecF
MILEEITLDNFRNYSRLHFRPGAGFNLLLGRNAQGKSNFLEALYALALGKSYRTAREEEVIGTGASFARAAGVFREGGVDFSLEVFYERRDGQARKAIRHNGNSLSRLSGFIDKAPMVLLSLDDLNMVRGSPDVRRRFIDLICSRLNPSHVASLREYRQTLDARNSWLKLPRPRQDPGLGEVYVERLCSIGCRITQCRLRTLKLIRPFFSGLYQDVLGAEAPRLSYRWSAGSGGEMPPEEVRQCLDDAFCRLRDAERERRFTMAGPHRDDLEIKKDGRLLRDFASMGEIRGAAAVLKLAEAGVLASEMGREPLILVDDSLNEFDPERAGLFLEHLSGRRQTFYATTRPLLPGGVSAGADVFLVKEGTITPCSLSQ